MELFGNEPFFCHFGFNNQPEKECFSYRPRLLSWCDRNNVDYLGGISKNSRLLKEVDVPSMLVRKAHNELGEKVSATYRFQYQAHTWKYPRWLVARLEEGELGANPRFIISSRYDDGFKLY